MKKTMKYMVITLIFMLLVTSWKQITIEYKESMDSLIDKNTITMEKVEILSNRVSNLEASKRLLLGLVDEQVTILSGELDDDYIVLPIYHIDVNTYDLRVQYYVMIQKNLRLEEKVTTLADKVSSYSFDRLPIELLAVETLDDGNKVAIINLIDSEDRINSVFRETWSGNYLQGSAGSLATTGKLVKTFLQSDFQGEWIDGVKFL